MKNSNKKFMSKNVLTQRLLVVIGFFIGSPKSFSQNNENLKSRLVEIEAASGALQKEIFGEVSAVDLFVDNLIGQIARISGQVTASQQIADLLPTQITNRLPQFCRSSGGIQGTGATGEFQCTQPPAPTRAPAKGFRLVYNETNIFLDRIGSSLASLSNIPHAIIEGNFYFDNGPNRGWGNTGIRFGGRMTSFLVPQNMGCRLIEIRARVTAAMGLGYIDNNYLRVKLRHVQNGGDPKFHLGAPENTQLFVGRLDGSNQAIGWDAERTSGPADFSLFRRSEDGIAEMWQTSISRDILIDPVANSDNAFAFDVDRFTSSTPTGGYATVICED